MRHFKFAATAAAAAIAVLATPVSAQTAGASHAEALRKLDIMLMVTSLRCRTTADNFQADYQRFSSNNLAALNAAARALQADMVRHSGAQGARRALDRISVGMANEYGRGHPWLGCGELKSITRDLASGRDSVQLAAVASELLSAKPLGRWAMAAAR